jgi:hypothetical protein
MNETAPAGNSARMKGFFFFPDRRRHFYRVLTAPVFFIDF